MTSLLLKRAGAASVSFGWRGNQRLTAHVGGPTGTICRGAASASARLVSSHDDDDFSGQPPQRKSGVVQAVESSLRARVKKIEERKKKGLLFNNSNKINPLYNNSSGGGGGGGNGARALNKYHTMQGREFCADLLVIGCGIAGSSAALKAASMGLQVMMLTSAHEPRDCNSYWAQGGIIYRAKDDYPGLLADDVHSAGAGICDHDAVMKLAEDGPARVEELLIDVAKVPFDRNADGELALCLEANHNRARIIHWRDQTGKAITESVQAAVFRHPNIRVLTGANVVDLALAHVGRNGYSHYHQQNYMAEDDNGNGGGGGGSGHMFGGMQCVGAHVLMQPKPDASGNGRNGNDGGEPQLPLLQTLLAKATVLATGGLGDLYEHTSNPSSAKGDGFAMALRAGAAMKNMEYVQFHPTTLSASKSASGSGSNPGDSKNKDSSGRSFLLTEALRGEGAVLRNEAGRRFAADYHPQAELAPRDVVSRMIVSEMERQGNNGNVYLDISHRDPEWIRNRFPGVHQGALKLGFDISTERVPVVPAAHYFCGGVMTDLEGRTTLAGLLCAGEVACTGLHGGNRLASTSLLEGLVWGCSLAEHLQTAALPDTNVTHLEALTAAARRATLLPHDHHHRVQHELTPAVEVEGLIDSAWKVLRRTMTEGVGVVRTERGVHRALDVLDELYVDAMRIYKTSRLSPASVALRNATETAGLIAQAAAANRRSVGAHFMADGEGAEEVREQQVELKRQRA